MMVDQAEIHRKAVSSKVKERIEAARQLLSDFADLPDKKEAWYDLHRLTQDEGDDVRREAAYALGSAFPHIPDKKEAWGALHRLTHDEDMYIRCTAAHLLGSAFPYIPNKKEAWDDLHRLTQDEQRYVLRCVSDAFESAFPHIPDKKEAWDDLIRLTQVDDRHVRWRAAGVLCSAFPHIPDKKEAWDDLIRLTRDTYGYVWWKTADALGSAFPHIPDKKEAWGHLHRLTQDEGEDVRLCVAAALGSAFPHIPDKKEAWRDLHRLTQDGDYDVRREAADALGSAFPHIPDKKEAWRDLHRLTQDEDDDVRREAAAALGSAFPHIPDKKEAGGALHRLTQDEDMHMRCTAAHLLGSAFPYIPNKKEAWEDLHRLARDKDSYVRQEAADALGSAFPHTPNKKEAWEDLHRLTQDGPGEVRMSANHSLGRLFIFMANETESEEKFKVVIENALEFFERSSNQATHINNMADYDCDVFGSLDGYCSDPSRFCLPFYRSFYAITFGNAGAKDGVQKYLTEAKSALEGSKNKKQLIEAVENLANALAEAQKAGGMNFGAIKSNLDACRRYCDRAADLIGYAEENAPGAARVLRRGLPIIDDQIKELLEEVKKKADIVCETTDRPESELACIIKQHAAAALATNNPVIVDRVVDNIIREFEKHISSITNETGKEYVQKSVTDAKNNDLMGKLLIITSLVAASPSFFKDGGEKMPKYEIKNSVVNIAEGDGISQSIHSSTNSQKDLSQNNAETHKSSEEPQKNTVPYLSDLESEICDIFKSVYQKERKEDASEVNSKTLEFLKYKLLDLTASEKRINWLDVGCGDGRSLDVLDAVQNIDNIRYHGIDSSYRYLDDTEERARKYKLNTRLDKVDAAAMKFDSEYDVVSSVLLLHEVDPLCLPYILRNTLRALKGDGTLIIADFQGPYEQEEGVVAWGAEDIENLLESIGGAKMSIEFIPSSQYPDELGFYRCYVKKPRLDREKFSELLQGYGNFLDAKKEESKWKRGELRSQIKERVRKLLSRSDLDLKNISEVEMRRIQTEIGDEYGIKAHKIRLLTNQIEFLDDKIKEFNSGVGCAGADQQTS